MRRVLLIGGLLFTLPALITMGWHHPESYETQRPPISGRRICLDRGGAVSYQDVEEYLVGIVAREISPDSQWEAQKAQAVIARTYLYEQMEGRDEIMESSLDLDVLEENQMADLWGKDKWQEKRERIAQAVRETGLTYLSFEGKPIIPLFHAVSAGVTRKGRENYPYLTEVRCPEDLSAPAYCLEKTMDKGQFCRMLSAADRSQELLPSQLPSSIQIVGCDPGGYIRTIQIGNRTWDGEELSALLQLPSASFLIEERAGKMRIVCLGVGHGYGLSQYQANCFAAEGWTMEEILEYFYPGTIICKNNLNPAE